VLLFCSTTNKSLFLVSDEGKPTDYTQPMLTDILQAISKNSNAENISQVRSVSINLTIYYYSDFHLSVPHAGFGSTSCCAVKLKNPKECSSIIWFANELSLNISSVTAI
jgi:hypothetical protein